MRRRAQAAEEPAALEAPACAVEQKNAPEPAQEAARAIPAKNPPGVVTLTVAKNWRCKNPALVVCEKDGEQVLLKVRPDRRENFRPHLTTGAPMTVQARWVIGNLYVIEGACPRFPGRW